MQQIVDIIDTPQIGSSNGNGSSTQHLEGTTVAEWVNMSSKILLRCHSMIRNIEGLQPQSAFDELCKMFLIKILIDENPQSEIANICQKGIRDEYEIKAFFDTVKEQYLEGIIDSDEEIKMKPQTFMQVLSELNRIESSVFIKIKGAIFEEFLNNMSRNLRDTLHIPSSVIDYMINVLDPQEGDLICDPNCGYGSFLTKSYDYLNGKHTYLYGMDTQSYALRLTRINKFIHGIKRDFKVEQREDFFEGWNSENIKFDIVFAHFPFNLRYGNKRFNPEQPPFLHHQTPDIWFIDACLKLLKEGGKIGVLLPEGVLFSPRFDESRRYIESQAKILKITSLPPNTLTNIGIKTSILFFQKFTLEEKNKYEFIYQNSKNGTDNDGIVSKIAADLDINYNFFYADITDVGTTARGYNSGNNQLLLLANEYKKALNDNTPIEKLTLLKQAKYAELYNWRVNTLKYAVIAESERNKRYKYVNLGSIIRKNTEYIKIEDTEEYKRVRVKLYDNGVELRDKVKGEEIGTKRQVRVSKGQFIIAKIGASSGAVGIIPEELDKAIVTTDFLTFNLVPNSVHPEYLVLLLSTNTFRERFEQFNSGTTIKRLDEHAFLNIEIPLPSLEEQEALCQKIVKLKRTLEQAVNELASEKQNFENTLFEN